jgi:ubiquitin conjugation factor E4 A
MASDNSGNPFSSLFSSPSQTKIFPNSPDLTNDEAMVNMDTDQSLKAKLCQVNDLLERIFLLSVDSDVVTPERKSQVPACCIFMAEFLTEDAFIHQEDLERMLFDRLMLTDLELRLVIRHENGSTENQECVKESHPLKYLWESFQRLLVEKRNTHSELQSILAQAEELIINNINSALLTPDIFLGVITEQNLMGVHHMLNNIINSTYEVDQGSCLHILFKKMCDCMDKASVETAFQHFFMTLSKAIKLPDMTLHSPVLLKHIKLLTMMSSIDKLAGALLNFKFMQSQMLDLTPSSMTTLLALLLGKTSLVTNPHSDQHAFFESPGSLYHPAPEVDRLQSCIDTYHTQLTLVFRNLLRHPHSKKALLTWIGLLMKQHAYNAKMWTHEQANPTRSVFATDGFFFNLASVLIRLSLPFCVHNIAGKPANTKFLKIDPTYCAACGAKDRLERDVHMEDMEKETCLISLDDKPEVDPKILSEKYNFISECFFLTHRALYLGCHGLLVKFYRLNRELGNLQNLYRDVMQRRIDDPQVADKIKAKFERAMSVYLSTKATLSEPEFLTNSCKFHATTATFLNQISYTSDRSRVVDTSKPLDSINTESLQILPEFLVENLVDFMTFLKRFQPSFLEKIGSFMDVFLANSTIFMGDKSRMTNTHLRASLAEILEAILPLKDDDSEISVLSEETFEKFQMVSQLTLSVIRLFVDIEFTGDPHAFEHKFNYRRPLYPILRFLWEDQRGKNAIKDCALESIRLIEAATPPLLLSFVNLFLNDAIFLLDEAINHLTQIKTEEKDRNDGKWENLPPQEKKEKEKTLKQLVQMARFHNTMSNETIDALAYLSTEVEVIDLLSHNTLVERIAAMLNYFLERLVGPKMGALKIQEFQDCEFKPKELVYGICKIYINIGPKVEFRKAISADGRSYNNELFPRAIRILRKIGHSELCEGLQYISQEVRKYGDESHSEDALFQDAPDEFFDPIMGTLMKDPVILPSSKVTVDRSTIARHLLSDHSDPFNRSALTMEQVTPDLDLLQRISDWAKNKSASTSS